MEKLINLHTNSEYSILESAISLEHLISYAKHNQLKYLSLTDHNTMFGVPEFYELCKKNSIKPIIGLDLDVENYRLVLIAKNYQGYLELIKLSSKKMLNENVELNHIDSTNLFIIDHPTKGSFSKFGQSIEIKNYYINSLDPKHKNAIFTKEIRILEKEDNEILKTFNQIANNEEEEFTLPEYEINEKLPQNVLNNIFYIIENSNVEFPKEYQNYLPQYDLKIDSSIVLKEIVYKNFLEKIKKFEKYQNVKERINYELNVINSLKFADYFLIIYDIVKFAKENKISVGPGRGSAAGSIVSYLLNITSINPLKYDLLFERFLNPERITMPDIDIDFQDDRRDEIVEYVTKKYGHQKVALITTFQRFGAKMALRDVGRNLNFTQVDMNNISKLVKLNQNLDEAYRTTKFKAQMLASPKHELLYKNARKIENFPRQVGTHAAGIIISNKNLIEIIPIMQSSVSNIQTQYSMNYLENFSLLKIDLLGLKALSTIKLIEQKIREAYKIKYNFSNEDEYTEQLKKDLDPKKAFQLLSDGNTAGVFQLESPGMIQTIKKVKISKFSDIVDVISLYRPGPMQYIQEYIDNKNDASKIKHVEKLYDEIVSKTHGIIIYQEQILEIVQKYAGLSYAKADILRRAISKKNSEEIEKFKDLFISSSIQHGQSEKVANEIFSKIENFAQYGFNKSHAVSYATTTFYFAQLKANFPLEFYTVLISSSDSLETINKYVIEAKNNLYTVESPDINVSDFKAFSDFEKIFLPLIMIKGLGKVAIQKILDERNQNGKYSSFFTLVARLNFVGITKGILEKLILSNALRNFGSMQTLLANLTQAYAYAETVLFKDENGIEKINFGLSKEHTIVEDKRDLSFEAKNESEYLGMVFNAFPTLKYETKNTLNNLILNIEYNVAIIVDKIFISRTKSKNKEYIKLIFSDRTKVVETAIFNDIEKYRELKDGDILIANIIMKKYDGLISYSLRPNWRIINNSKKGEQ